MSFVDVVLAITPKLPRLREIDDVTVPASQFSMQRLACLQAASVDAALALLRPSIADSANPSRDACSLDRRSVFTCMVERSLPVPLDLLGIRSLLLIDDEPAILRSMSRTLRQAVPELTVWMAEGPKNGLAQVANLQPDAVLVDAYMPITGGPELCSQILALGGSRPSAVLGMTADPSPELALAFARAGAIAFLEKPVAPAAVFEALSAYLLPNLAGEW